MYPHQSQSNLVHFPPSSLVRHNFLNALNKQFHPSSSFKIANFTHQVEILIRTNDLFQYGHTIDPTKHYHINAIFEEKLKNDLYFIITTLRSSKYGMPLNQAIEHYRDLYGFTEEIFAYEAIAQAYHRAKIKAEKLLHNCHKIKPCASLQLET